jgi:phospholipid/cholesterol/gamma-HCH transport system permease protein
VIGRGLLTGTGTVILRLLQGVGEVLLLLGQAIRESRTAPRNVDKILAHMAEIGNATLPLASLTAIFIGGVLSLQSGFQLAKLGAEENLGGLVGLSMVKELGPVMTSLLLAGRVGSAMAAEIGAMAVYEEIDALRTLDIDPVRYLVMPRVVASLLTLPVLTIYVDVLGWFGGALVGSVNPRINVSFHTFFNNLRLFMEVRDVLDGLVKAMVFGVTVAIVCCHVGLQTRGGPREVGRSVTRAVVLSFICIFIFDYIITRLLI